VSIISSASPIISCCCCCCGLLFRQNPVVLEPSPLGCAVASCGCIGRMPKGAEPCVWNMPLRGDRAFTTLGLCISSRMDGATYVNPWNTILALSLRVESSGESIGVCLVKRVSNWDTSSALARQGLKGGSSLRRATSLQSIILKNGCIRTGSPSVTALPKRTATCLFNSFRIKSRASGVRYGGKLSLPFKIFSIVFFRFSAVNGGWRETNEKNPDK